MMTRLALAFGLLLAPVAAHAQQAVRDVYSGPFLGETAVTVATPIATPYVMRGLKAICTAGGALSINYPDGTTGQWTVQGAASPAVTTVLPIVATQVTASTATCTYAALK